MIDIGGETISLLKVKNTLYKKILIRVVND
jgi:hypothetical protein